MAGEAFADGACDEFVRHHVGVGYQLGLMFVIGAQGVVVPLAANQFAGLAGQVFGKVGNLEQRN